MSGWGLPTSSFAVNGVVVWTPGQQCHRQLVSDCTDLGHRRPGWANQQPLQLHERHLPVPQGSSVAVVSLYLYKPFATGMNSVREGSIPPWCCLRPSMWANVDLNTNLIRIAAE